MASSKQHQIEEDRQDNKYDQVREYFDLNLPESVYRSSSSQTGSVESNNVGKGIERETRMVYPCTYCSRKFCNSRALGGHQNAHKRERAITRRGSGALGLSSSSSSTSIGIQSHSLIHKSQNSNSPPMFAHLPLHGYPGWARNSLNLQPAVAQLASGSNYIVGNPLGSWEREGVLFDGFRKYDYYKSENQDDDDEKEERRVDLSLKL